MTKLYNRSSELEKRKQLRNHSTPAETVLWEKLRKRQLSNCRFRRQYSIGAFVVDFYCPELKLAIEVDGESHTWEGAAESDQQRQNILEHQGICFLRFSNQQVYTNIQSVLTTITDKIQQLCDDRHELEIPNPYTP